MNTSHPHAIRNATIIWVIASIVGAVVYYIIAPILAANGAIPTLASQTDIDAYNIMYIFTYASIPVFMFVVVFAGYAIFAFRVPSRPTEDGPSMRGNTQVQISWLLVSFALVLFLYIVGFAGLAQIEAAAPASSVQVNVTGQQWLWTYAYPGYKNAGSTTLYLPVNQPVEFNVTSLDVQHSFWIPELGIKQDAVPGEMAHTWVTPNKIGDYTVRCVELCGVYHAYMNTPVVVMSQSDFQAMVQSLPPNAAASSSFTLPSLPAMALVGVAGQRS
ncbi:MAG: cytochrome c oxidase subunit II [Ktedonobacterales bacterium]